MSETATWTSNSTLDEMARRLGAAQRVVLLTHSKPDGDAIGSTLALARALARLGVDAVPAYTGPWQHRFDQLVGDTGVLRVDAGERSHELLDDPDVVVVADTGSWSQLSEVRSWLSPRRERTMVIDHHLHGDPDVGDMRVIAKGASAAAQIVSELCLKLLNIERASKLPVEIAEPLYVGLATDTGWFRHSNVRPETMKLASELLHAGVDHTALYQRIEQVERVARLALLGRALASIEMHDKGRAAVMSLRQKDFEETGGEVEDAGGFVDLPMTVAQVRVVAVLTELDEKTTKVSMRSKRSVSDGDVDPHPTVDVNAIAMSLGGGGHAQAAGAKLDLPLDQARAKVVEAIERHSSE